MMNRVPNKTVVSNWYFDNPSASHNGQLSTDGKNLFSYRQLIGVTLADGSKVALNYRSGKGGCYIGQTTSTHVGYASQITGVTTMSPEVAKEAGLIDVL